jgi:hypothetical protein
MIIFRFTLREGGRKYRLIVECETSLTMDMRRIYLHVIDENINLNDCNFCQT